MADYRDWCGYCHAETNFGSHKADCAWVAKQDAARRELHEFEDRMYEEYSEKSKEDLLDEAVNLDADILALATMLAGKEKKWKFIRYELCKRGLIDDFKEETGNRFI